MRIDPAGWPFIGGALLIGLALSVTLGNVAGLVFFVLAGFFLFFFRDPDRTVTQAANAVLSPADGRVMVAGKPTGEQTPSGDWQQITIFLSPMDVHVNRMPMAGRVRKVSYHPGRFLPAYRADAGDLNEHTEVWLEHQGQTIVVRQIVGILARRIVCRAREGDTMQAGQRFGVMKFGSRMDVFVPVGSVLRVNVGDRVVGAVSVIAELPR
ncbi:MAG: phosphatidylserine decarboxylase family protein [Acidobacteria bacterium]|nr:phosphatidylserine decarboxylase family protein [Acidobacteriota bacterium]